MIITDEQKAGMFRLLATKTFYDVGVEFGFDKHYKTPTAVKGAVYRAYQEVKASPEKFSVHPDTASLVVAAVSNRSIAIPTKKTIAEQNEDTRGIEELLLSNRDLANRLVHKKLVALDASKKALRNESVVSLGKIFGILFDKSQIIRGQATEHVSHLSKIDVSGLTPEATINLVLAMRESQMAGETKEENDRN